jgi:hypothetical protein
MIAPGKYLGTPVSAALGFTSSGSEQIAVLFEFLEPAGERLTWYGYFTEKTFDRTIESLRACGWMGSSLDEFGSEHLPGGFNRQVELVVTHEEYNGKTSARIAFVNNVGGGMALKSAMDANQARAFAAKMKGRIAALGMPSSAPTPTAKPAVKPAPKVRAAPPPPEVPQEVLDQQENDHVDVPF